MPPANSAKYASGRLVAMYHSGHDAATPARSTRATPPRLSDTPLTIASSEPRRLSLGIGDALLHEGKHFQVGQHKGSLHGA